MRRIWSALRVAPLLSVALPLPKRHFGVSCHCYHTRCLACAHRSYCSLEGQGMYGAEFLMTPAPIDRPPTAATFKQKRVPSKAEELLQCVKSYHAPLCKSRWDSVATARKFTLLTLAEPPKRRMSWAQWVSGYYPVCRPVQLPCTCRSCAPGHVNMHLELRRAQGTHHA